MIRITCHGGDKPHDVKTVPPEGIYLYHVSWPGHYDSVHFLYLCEDHGWQTYASTNRDVYALLRTQLPVMYIEMPEIKPPVIRKEKGKTVLDLSDTMLEIHELTDNLFAKLVWKELSDETSS